MSQISGQQQATTDKVDFVAKFMDGAKLKVDFVAKFMDGAKLKVFLAEKKPDLNIMERQEFSINEVLQMLKEVITVEKLYDDLNPSIILCDEHMETALDVKALHWEELKEHVSKQLVKDVGIAQLLPAEANGDGVSGPAHERQQQQQQQKSLSLPRAGVELNRSLLGGQKGIHIQASSPQSCSPLSSPNLASLSASVPPSWPTPAKNGLPASEQPAPATGAAAGGTLRPVRCNTMSPTLLATSALSKNELSVSGPSSSSVPLARSASLDPASSVSTADITAQSLFKMKPLFLQVLQQVKGMDKQKEVFTYAEVTKFLSQYILENKSRFFDTRNIRVVLCGGDLLGQAFGGIRAFHRSQVTALLRTQLLPVNPKPEEVPKPEVIDVSSGDDECVVVETRKSQATPNLPPTSTAPTRMTTTAGSTDQPIFSRIYRRAPNTSKGPSPVGLASPLQQKSRVRKRSCSNSDDDDSLRSPFSANLLSSLASAPASLAGKRRRRHRTNSLTYAIVEASAFGKDDSSGDETIYSEQGYETAVMCNGVGGIDGEEEEEETTEDEQDVPNEQSEQSEQSEPCAELEQQVEQVERVAQNQEEDFTEYELDSEADREEEKQIEMRECESSDSEEDSDTQDGVFVLEFVLSDNGGGDDDDDEQCFADSESDIELQTFDIVSQNLKTAKKQWKCLDCRQDNSPCIKYCSSCWQLRKGWLPDRPKPRRRRRNRNRKNKRTEGLPVKSSSSSSSQELFRQALNRSISDPGSRGKGVIPLQGKEKDNCSVTSEDNDHEQQQQQQQQLLMRDPRTKSSSLSPTYSNTDSGYSQSLVDSLESLDFPTGPSTTTSSGFLHGQTGTTSSALQASSSLATKGTAVELGEVSLGPGKSTTLNSPYEDDSHSHVTSSSSGCCDGDVMVKENITVAAASENPSSRNKVSSASASDSLCSICLTRENDTGIIHGNVMHACCYPCGKKLMKKRQRCPMCRRKIEKIVKSYSRIEKRAQDRSRIVASLRSSQCVS